MIKYLLICKSCDVEFESWFATSKEFDKLKKLKLLNCQNCNSQKIEKSLMKPNLANANFKQDNTSKNNKNFKKKIKEYQKFIKDNFQYVGKILHMRQDPFIIIKIRIKKIFTVKHQLMM